MDFGRDERYATAVRSPSSRNRDSSVEFRVREENQNGRSTRPLERTVPIPLERNIVSIMLVKSLLSAITIYGVLNRVRLWCCGSVTERKGRTRLYGAAIHFYFRGELAPSRPRGRARNRAFPDLPRS